MKVFGLRGWSGSGKTTLLVTLIPELTARGLTVSTVKHAHHGFDLDRPGKDSYRHREAGATEVMIAAAGRWALLHEHRAAAEPTLDDLLKRLTPVDLVLVEGYRAEPHGKIEVWRPATGQPLVAPDDPHVVAIATDRPVAVPATLRRPVLQLDDAAAIADFITEYCGLNRAARTGT
jgi:molybdopterin-guanine dinucleotide biosynthesis protein B